MLQAHCVLILMSNGSINNTVSTLFVIGFDL